MGESQEETEEIVENDNQETPINKNETARESVLKSIKELESDGSEDAETAPEAEKPNRIVDGPDTPGAETLPKKAKEPKQDVKNDAFDPELSPPERFRADQKELFNNLPKGLKRALNKTVKDHEAHFTSTQQELTKELRDVQGLKEVISHYATDWNEQGLTASQAIAELAAAQKKLTSPDINVRRQAFSRMAKGCGIDPKTLDDDEQPTQQNNPEVQALKNEINRLSQLVEPVAYNYQQQSLSQNRQAADANIASMQQVRDEVDPRSGKYRYPNLHDDGFINQARPLVEALVRTVPGITAGEALRRAHDQLVNSGNSNQQYPTQPLAGNQEIQQRASNAAVSVRGRSVPGISSPNIDDIPDSVRTPADTVRYILKNGLAG